MHIDDFTYDLPEELIAQQPTAQRDQSRLFVVSRLHGSFEHRLFPNLVEYLRAGDLLVMNDSKVIPARIRAFNVKTRGEFEILLLEENQINDWWVMLRPGRRARPGTEIIFVNHEQKPTGIGATVSEVNVEGHRRLLFSGTKNILNDLTALGEIPLPPYIQRNKYSELSEDWERYQTVYAKPPGSVAAPTAGLHFTTQFLDRIQSAGVNLARVTLHVGLGTFAPVKTNLLEDHHMHEERYEVSEETAEIVRETQSRKGRIIAVGTTSFRALESAALLGGGNLLPGKERTRLFVYPPRRFHLVDALLTNFHLPKSTLLMLVSAFAAPGETSGRELMLKAYAEAVRLRYRFFSYGDAMFIC